MSVGNHRRTAGDCCDLVWQSAECRRGSRLLEAVLAPGSSLSMGRRPRLTPERHANGRHDILAMTIYLEPPILNSISLDASCGARSEAQTGLGQGSVRCQIRKSFILSRASIPLRRASCMSSLPVTASSRSFGTIVHTRSRRKNLTLKHRAVCPTMSEVSRTRARSVCRWLADVAGNRSSCR